MLTCIIILVNIRREIYALKVENMTHKQKELTNKNEQLGQHKNHLIEEKELLMNIIKSKFPYCLNFQFV